MISNLSLSHYQSCHNHIICSCTLPTAFSPSLLPIPHYLLPFLTTSFLPLHPLSCSLHTVVLEYDRKDNGELGQLGMQIRKKRFESYNQVNKWITCLDLPTVLPLSLTYCFILLDYFCQPLYLSFSLSPFLSPLTFSLTPTLTLTYSHSYFPEYSNIFAFFFLYSLSLPIPPYPSLPLL